MSTVWIAVAVVALVLLFLALAVRIVKQYEQGVLFRLGRVIGVRKAGLTFIIPVVEREKRAEVIAAEGEALAADALGTAADIMLAHPLALQLRNLQSLVEIGVDKNTTVVFPAPLMSTIGDLGAFLTRETAASAVTQPVAERLPNGKPVTPATQWRQSVVTR